MANINNIISQIKLPNNEIYDIQDKGARDLINSLSSYTDYLGVSTTVITDGGTETPTIAGKDNIALREGNIVTYNKKEFIWNGAAWQEFGDLSALGALAYKNSASGTFTPTGSISATFAGEAVTFKPSGTIAEQKFTGTDISYTPGGNVTKPSFTGEPVNYTPKGTISKIEHTPAGTVTQPTFTGTKGNVATTGTATGTTVANGETADYTPAGTISVPAVTKPTTTVNSVTNVGTLPSCNLPELATSVDSNGLLTLSWTAGQFDAGALPTTNDNITVVTNVEVAAPTFTGTGAKFTVAAQGEYTPSGTVSQPTFDGKLFEYTPTFAGTEESITAKGEVSKPTFEGIEATLQVEGKVDPGQFTGNDIPYTPAGGIASTFTGTEGTVTVF